jgi:hypothetical protein
MKPLGFLASIALFAVTSYSSDEPRQTRFDEHECPFCTMEKGICTYCKGTKKCSFCKGSGTREVVVDGRSNEKIIKTTYKESCTYCNGTGACRYCGGKGICWACDGTGRIESWDFFSKARKIDSAERHGLP